MTNRITLQGKLLDVAKIRTYEARGETFEVVQLWIEVSDGQRRDRFNVDVHDGKAATAAKALPKDALVEITGSSAATAGRIRLPRPGAARSTSPSTLAKARSGPRVSRRWRRRDAWRPLAPVRRQRLLRLSR